MGFNNKTPSELSPRPLNNELLDLDTDETLLNIYFFLLSLRQRTRIEASSFIIPSLFLSQIKI